MLCPICNTEDTKVIDSRLVSGGLQVRRRRECVDCNERFTTYETVEVVMPLVIKRDGTREEFSDDNLRKGLLKSLEKRPIGIEQIEAVITTLKRELRSIGAREIHSKFIGEKVMKTLKSLDEVAYVRFASVYKSFEAISDFDDAIKTLQTKTVD